MNIIYSYLRENKAEQLRQWYNEPLRFIDNLNTECYQNATVLPLKEDTSHVFSWGIGGVNDENNEYIPSSSCLPLYGFGYQPNTAEECHEEVIYGGYFRKHWGDFLADCVQRLWFALYHTTYKIVYFVEENGDINIKGNYREFFELLGVWNRILIINRPTRYDKIYIPQCSYSRSEKYYSKQYLDIFNIIAENVKSIPGGINEYFDKIFFTRSKFKKAIDMEYGMDLIDSYFAKNEYHIVSPENLSLSKMIRLIRNAKTVASFSGTLPHNMLFAKNGQRIEIVERNALNNQYQHYFSIMKNLQTVYIDANFTIFPVELTYGPFIYGYTECLKQFTEDMKYKEPEEKYLTDSYKKSLFKKYMDAYRKEHYLRWYMGGSAKWMTRDIKILYEAYEESANYFEPWISGQRMYSFDQCLDVRFNLIRRMIKKIIRESSKKDI